VRIPLNRYVLFFSLAAIGCAVDLITKSVVFAKYFDPNLRLDPHQAQEWWIGEIFGIQTHTNPGALFGIGEGMSFWFAMLSLFAITAILMWLFVFKAATERVLTFALGMVTGGILGNMYDRLGFGFTEGHPVEIKYNVRDWIYFHLHGVAWFDPWPNFNIADTLLVVGAGILFFHAFFFTNKISKSTLETADTASKDDNPSKSSASEQPLNDSEVSNENSGSSAAKNAG